MKSIRRVAIALCAAAALSAPHAVPASAVTEVRPEKPSHALQIDPCKLLGWILGDRC